MSGFHSFQQILAWATQAASAAQQADALRAEMAAARNAALADVQSLALQVKVNHMLLLQSASWLA